MNKRRGRPRAGRADGKERILDAARRMFLSRGYQPTSLRAIAAEAGCDVALIGYHFGSKKGLFAHAVALEVAPSEVLERALPGDPESLGVRLVTLVTAAWRTPAISASLNRLVQLAMTDDEARRAFVGYLDREIHGRLVEYFGGADATARASAVLTLIVGVIFGRNVLQIPALTDSPNETYLRAIRPAARAAAAPVSRRSGR